MSEHDQPQDDASQASEFWIDASVPDDEEVHDVLELLLLANVVTALVAAVSIYRQRQWGWLVGLVVAGASMLLYLAQETVGLPGLPKAWLEPSRLVSLLADLLFVGLAVRHLRRARAVRAVRTRV